MAVILLTTYCGRFKANDVVRRYIKAMDHLEVRLHANNLSLHSKLFQFKCALAACHPNMRSNKLIDKFARFAGFESSRSDGILFTCFYSAIALLFPATVIGIISGGSIWVFLLSWLAPFLGISWFSFHLARRWQIEEGRQLYRDNDSYGRKYLLNGDLEPLARNADVSKLKDLWHQEIKLTWRFHQQSDRTKELELIDKFCAFLAIMGLDANSEIYSFVFYAVEELLDLQLRAKVLSSVNNLELDTQLQKQIKDLTVKLDGIFAQGQALVVEQITQQADYQQAYYDLEKVEAGLLEQA